MKSINLFLVPAAFLLCVAFSACEKLPLQKKFKYEQSFYDNKLNMSVMDFMKSRPDIFAGQLAAIAYLELDPGYKGFSEIYSQPGNTYLLLTDNALTSVADLNSFFWKNPFYDPAQPTVAVPGSDWSQYDRKVVADLLRYHVLKGIHRSETLNSTPKWVDTYALSATNDTAKVNIYMQATREGYIFINNYPGTTTGIEIRPRTPDLVASNGSAVHVMNRYAIMPTRQALTNNQ